MKKSETSVFVQGNAAFNSIPLFSQEEAEKKKSPLQVGIGALRQAQVISTSCQQPQ